jgi:hypothetical protein
MERETLRSQRANTPSVSFSPQLFGNPLNLTGRYVDAEKAALEGLLPNREIAGQATLLNPSDLAKMSDEELLGLLSLREAQMAAAYGPARRDLLSPVDKPRAETMARMHQSPYRAAPGRISVEPQAAIGANTMLRQVTTEEAAKRLLLGQDPFEIAEDIVKMTERPLEVFKGRYAQGGLAHAAS